MKQVKYSALLFLLVFFSCSNNDDENGTKNVDQTVADIDGNIYSTITIGHQVWMLENLKTTKLNDGTPITEWAFGMDWGSLNDQKPLYQWAETSDLNGVYTNELPFDFYGAMYNHFAIESGKLAPKGWRIPSEQDFIELENYLSNSGNSGEEATALKSTIGWLDSSSSGTNIVNFNALPNGYVAAGGTATASEIISSLGTSNVSNGEINSSLTRRWVQLFNEPTIMYSDNSILLGVGIRCIKE
ncbi:FISUMP domain-containing protein [Algibacter aquimarinus]|uniref:Fibrobacter succinogenes major paralogous domain-containing protein n=1 Tax=Algibacter aquimarinus TaxID=1136748 RepID=A0ABP9HB32_9FLAO